MAYIHKPKLIEGYERDTRVARVVMKRLRNAGFTVRWLDKRDVYGARVHPVNLECNGVSVLVRRLGALDVGSDLAYVASHPNAYIQRGSSDVSELIAKVQAMSMPHWNA